MHTELSPLSVTPIQVVQAIQAAKQAQGTYAKKDLAARAQLISQLAEQISHKQIQIVEDMAREQGLPIQFTQTELIDPLQKKFENLAIEIQIFAKPETLLPVGIVAAGVTHALALPQILFIAANCIAAGNGAVISCPESARVSATWAQKLLAPLCPEGLISILVGSQDQVVSLLAGHPGISSFFYRGDFLEAEAPLKAALLKRKKVQFFTGAKNSTLVHPDFDFENNMDKILRPFLVGQGQIGIGSHRLFINQSVEKKFYEALVGYMDDLKPSEDIRDNSPWTPLLSHENVHAWGNAVQQVPLDSGKILFGGKKMKDGWVQPTWTQDLSNCSEMQQHEIQAPFFIVTAVKYNHEMVKWSNTGYLGHSAIVWGPEDKATNLAMQLQVGHVHLNRWTGFYDMGLPVKQSFLGNPDVKWSGSFYSDVKRLTSF